MAGFAGLYTAAPRAADAPLGAMSEGIAGRCGHTGVGDPDGRAAGVLAGGPDQRERAAFAHVAPSGDWLLFSGHLSDPDALDDLLLRGGMTPEGPLAARLLQAYKCLGTDLVARLSGAFSLALYDAARRRVLLAVDPFGLSPLYYSRPMAHGTVFFGTDIAAFAPHPDFERALNPRALKPYLTLQYNPLPETFWSGVFRLDPGTYALLTEEGLETTRYFTPSFEPDDASLDAHVDRIRDAVEGAVDRLARVGSFGAHLSGGIDSGYVTALARPDVVFSVRYEGYHDRFNEADDAERLARAFGLSFHAAEVNAADYMAALPHVQTVFNEPNGNLSAVPLYLLNRLASSHVPHVFTGDGADELFGGYETYHMTRRQARYARLVPRRLREALARRVSPEAEPFTRGRLLRQAGLPLEAWYLGQSEVYAPEAVDRLLRPAYRVGPDARAVFAPAFAATADLDDVTRRQLLDLRFEMPGEMATKSERMSAAHNVTLLTPFLEPDVYRAARVLPPAHRVSDETTKLALRRAADNVLPTDRAQRRKLGFIVPFADYLRDDALAEPVLAILRDPLTDEFFDRARLLDAYAAHRAGRTRRHRHLYVALAFLCWYRCHFGD